MNINIHSSRWLNQDMDICTIKFDDGYSCAVSITGVEYLDNGRGGKVESIRYGLRLCDEHGEEYLCRVIANNVVSKALSNGSDVLTAVLDSFESEDGQPEKLAGEAHSDIRARVDRAELSFLEMKEKAARDRNAARF